ncbi:anaphase-promoting complex subunit 11 RING-H2 finger-domain-containing protein [Aspergillus navahoensis]
MKVTLKEWNAVATWRWDMPEDEVCGICRVQFDGTCPTCKFPGDDCSLLLGKCGHSFHMTSPSAMSLPKPAISPSLSSSTSKQSLRRPSSRPHNIDQVAQPQPTDHHEHPSPHIGAAIGSHLAEPNDQTYHKTASPSVSHILSQPFFTLIEDTHTSEYYHPTVHYIFSDDDTDIVTEAALRSLELEHDILSNTNTKGKSKVVNRKLGAGAGVGEHESAKLYEDANQTRKETLLPDPIPGVRDNYIILDIDHVHPRHGDEYPAGMSPETHAQGQPQGPTPNIANLPYAQQELSPPQGQLSITSAHSLSPSWQVLNTQLLSAPTFENNSSEKPVNGGLMLQIQGTSGLPIATLGRDKEPGEQRLEDMMDQFARRMEELRLVIENGERGMATGIEGSSKPANPLAEPDAQDAADVGPVVESE